MVKENETENDKIVAIDNKTVDDVTVPDVLIEPIGYDNGKIKYQKVSA